MKTKWDRTSVRKAEELERKYNLASESQVMNVAADAMRKAEQAEAAADSSVANIVSLDRRVSALENGGSPGGSIDLGLSVVNGMICVTYESGV